LIYIYIYSNIFASDAPQRFLTRNHDSLKYIFSPPLSTHCSVANSRDMEARSEPRVAPNPVSTAPSNCTPTEYGENAVEAYWPPSLPVTAYSSPTYPFPSSLGTAYVQSADVTMYSNFRKCRHKFDINRERGATTNWEPFASCQSITPAYPSQLALCFPTVQSARTVEYPEPRTRKITKNTLLTNTESSVVCLLPSVPSQEEIQQQYLESLHYASFQERKRYVVNCADSIGSCVVEGRFQGVLAHQSYAPVDLMASPTQFVEAPQLHTIADQGALNPYTAPTLSPGQSVCFPDNFNSMSRSHTAGSYLIRTTHSPTIGPNLFDNAGSSAIALDYPVYPGPPAVNDEAYVDYPSSDSFPHNRQF
jgi:hypothetical protein